MRELNFSQTLLYFDRPILILAEDVLGSTYLCLLVEENERSSSFLCIPASSRRLKQLRLNEIDLRSAFRSPEISEFYKGETKQGDTQILAAETLKTIPDEWLPETGVFLNVQFDSDNLVLQESTERHAAIIHTTLTPPEAATESKISAEHLSDSVRLFQAVVKHAYKKAIIGADQLLREIIEQPSNYQLDVFAFSDGSFKLHMEAHQKADLLGYANISKAFAIIDSVSRDMQDVNKSIETISVYSGNFVNAYKRLLKFVIDTSTPIEYEWAMPEQKTTSKGVIIPRFASPLYKAIVERAEMGIERIVVRGRFEGVQRKKGTWTITSEEGKSFNGKTSLDLQGTTIHSTMYEFICEEILEEDAMGKEYSQLNLVSFRPIE